MTARNADVQGATKARAAEWRQCSKTVFTDRFGGSPCAISATVEENGKLWCRRHAPSLLKAKLAEQEREWVERRQAQAHIDAERAYIRRLGEVVAACPCSHCEAWKRRVRKELER